MRDKISIPRAKLLHPAIREEVINLIDRAEKQLPVNLAVRIVEGLRTFDQQEAYYAQGRTKPGKIVTNAKAGFSYHQYGLAIDFAILVDKDGNGTYDELSWDTDRDRDGDGKKDWLEIVSVFKPAGYIWGADWDNDGITKAQGDKDEHLVDMPHIQKTFGYTTKELLAKYLAKDFFPGTKYVNL